MNDETNPVQRGLDTLNASPVEHLENSSPQIQEELGARSEQIQQEVAAKSALPNPNQFNLYNRDGEFITDGEAVDGDGPVSGFRIAYNPEVEADQGKSFDAWETDHGDDFNNSPAQAKKLARQRRALADLLGEPVEAITNEDVFAMGEASKQRAAEFFRTQDGINKITVDDSQTFKSNREGDDRVLGHVFRNAEGTDIRTFMNNPLDNANFNSRFNIRGRAEAELGAGLKGEQELSDFEATETTQGRIDNAGLTLRDALNNTSADIGDFFANTIGKIAGQFKAGEADITPEDEATFRRIRENMVQAEKEAELEIDKANASSKNEQIEDATAEAVANLYGDPVPESPTTSFAKSDERKAAVAKRADEILRSRLSPEEIAFMDGVGTATRVTKSTSTSKLFDSAELRGEVGKVVETENDKFETLDTQRKVRESIHKVGQTTLGDIASGEAFEEDRDTKVNPVTGAPESFKTANTALSDIADKDKEILGLKKDSDKILADINEDTPTLLKAGKYLTVAAKWVQGGGKRLIKHPEASFLGVLQSAPEIAAMVTLPTIAVTSKTHKNYEDGKESFFNDRGRFPNEQEQNILLTTSTASALIEKIGADVAASPIKGLAKSGFSKLSSEASKNLTKLISSKLPVTAAHAATLSAAAVVEGGEEALVSILEQVGKNQGKDKLIDSDQVYDSFVKGVATGGAMRSVLDSPNVANSLKSDIRAAYNVSVNQAKGALGKGLDIAKTKIIGTDATTTTERRKEVADKVVADVARSSGTNVDEVLTPNVTLVEGASPTFTEAIPETAPKNTKERLATAFEDMGKVTADTLETPKGLAESLSVVHAAERALQNNIQELMDSPNDISDAQLEDIQTKQAIVNHAKLIIDEKSKALEDAPIITPENTSELGELITRGSAAVAQIDTSSLQGEMGIMVTRLAEFDKQLAQTNANAPKSFKVVQGEVLGTRTNSRNKAGLGQHLSNLGAAIVGNNAENAVNAVASMTNFRNLQQSKYNAISEGYAQFQRTGKEVTVNYGKEGKSSFVVNSGATEGFLNHLNNEINIIDEAITLGRDLGEAHFAPEAYKKRKDIENQTAIEEAKRANATAVSNPPSVEGVEAGNEVSEASEVTGAETTDSRAPRSRQEIGREAQDVNRQITTLESEIAAAPTKAEQDSLITELDQLIARREALRVEFSGEPTAPLVTPTNPEPVTGIIQNSPQVEARESVVTPTPLEAKENTLFSDAAIELALGKVKEENKARIHKGRGEIKAPLLDNILAHSANVKHRSSKSDAPSARALRPLSEMIVPREDPQSVVGLIGKSNNIFQDLRQMSDDRFTEAEWEAINEINKFSLEFSEATDAIMPAVEQGGKGIQPALNGEEFIVFRELANRSPVFQFMDETGRLAPQVKDAMSVAILDWVQSNGSATMYQTSADVYRFFGIDERQGGLTDDAINAVSVLGSHASPQALSVGQAVLRNLNIQQNPDTKLDGLYETRLAQSIGDMAFVAMSNMTTTNSDGTPGESRGYLEFNSIPTSVLNDLSGKEVEPDNVDGNSRASATFLRLPIQVGDNGLPLYNDSGYVLGDSLNQLMTLTRSEAFKSTMRTITGKHRSEGGVTALPKRRAPEYHTGTTTKLSPVLKKYVETLNAQTLIKNPQWDLMEAFGDEGKKDWLRIHGWVEPTVDANGNTSFPNLHDAHAISANGKNMGLEREYAQMQEHLLEWDNGLAEAKIEQARVVEESLIRELRGEDTKELTIHLDRLDREIKAYESGDIHLEHHVISTGRVNDRTSTLSIQRSKMHRNALSFKDHVETIDITNPDHRFAVIAGLVEPLDLSEAGLTESNGELEFHLKYMDQNGNAADPVIRKGIEAIQAQMRGDAFSTSDIADAVEQIGEGAHTLSGLMVVANWSNAIKNGETTFESYGYTEVDGTTNGVIASMRQLVGGYDPTDTNPAPGSKTKRIRDLFNAGGQIFADQDYREGIDYLKENPDAYQNIGNISADRLGPMSRGVRDQDLESLRVKVSDAQEARAKVKNSDHADQMRAQEALDNAQGEYGVKVFETTLPDFSLVNGKVTKAVRTMMKAIVMPGGYQAGDTALANSLFNDWLADQYTAMASGELDAINETLSRAGLPQVSADNAKRVLPAETLKDLRYVFNNSIGKIITQAYRESMGDFNENAKAINAAYGVMAIIATDVTKSALADLERKKGSALTNEEILAERRRLQEEDGVFIGYRQVGAESFADSVSIVKDEKEIVSPERGGYVFSAFADGAIRTNNYAFNSQGILEAQRGVKSSSRTSRIKELVPSADIGVAGMITSIIGIDANTQALARAESNTARGNVFDANITGFLDAQNEAVTTNRVWNNIHERWSVWNAVGDQLEHLMKNYPNAATSEINEFFKAYDVDERGVETGNKFAPVITNADGSTENFSGISDFMRYFKSAQAEGNAQRQAVNKNLIGTAQHRIAGGTYFHKGAESAEVQRGSSDERIDLGSFDNALRTKATPESVSKLFYGYLDKGAIQDSAAHKERLTHLMDKHVLPLVASSAGYTVNVATNPGTAGGAAQGQNIYIRPSDSAIRQFSTEMSDAEVLTHEFLHPIVEAGLADNTRSIRRLNELQRQVIESPTFTPESFIDPTDVDQKTAREKAQRLYDYITGDIHEFMVFGLSNNVVRNALENEIVEAQTGDTVLDRLLGMLRDLVARLTGQVIGKTAAPTNVASNLDTLINGFDTTTRTHLARKVGSVVNNKYVTAGRGFLAEKAGKPLMEWGQRLSFRVPVSQQAQTGSRPSTAESLLAIAKSPVRVFDTGFQKAAAASTRVLTDHKQDFFSKLARETMGAMAVDRPYHTMLSRVNEHVDSASLRMSAEIKKAVTNAFTRSLKSSEHKMLADTVLRGDLKVFRNMSTDTLAELVSDTAVLDARIRSTLGSLQSTDKTWINNQARSLGSVMAQGRALVENGNLNAFNIATGVSHPDGLGIVEADTALIDELKSLYAIKFMEVGDRNNLAEMLYEQPVGVSTIMEVDAVNHADALQHTYNGDRSRVVAGEVISKSTNRSSAVILPSRDHAKHVGAGWTLVKPMGSSLSLYSRADIPAEGYQKGIFSMGNAELEGTAVKREDRGGASGLLPVVSGGRVIGYRAIMDKATRELDAGMSIGAAESLGNHGGRIHRLSKGTEFNDQIVEMARQDYLANGKNTSAFIRVSPNSTNAQVAEFARLMPREMRNQIRETWNGDMYLRKNQLDLLLGFRKLSLIDEINRRRVSNGEQEFNGAVTNTVRLAGDIWQSAVSEVKKRTVLFTPAVVAGNFLSNLAVSMLHGMNPVDIVRDQREGWRAIKDYTDWQDQLAALDLKIKLGENVQANTAQRKRVQIAMESSGVHNMVQAGMFQTIVEDIDISAGGEPNPLNAAIQQALPDSANQFIEENYRALPDSVKKGIGVVMLSPSTEFGANVQTATAYSDFTARYAMMKHLRKKGVSEADAMAQVMDIYVDYAPNTSREMQYINDSGLYMYTKFLMRIQRVIMRAFRNHPEAVLAMEAAQQALGDISDITDSSLLWGISLSGGRTQTPDEALETLTQLPLFHMLGGLKDVM